MAARRWLVVVILAICVGAPIAEAFDWWDRTLPAGDDTESSVVVVALSVGLALSVAAIVIKSLQRFIGQSRRIIRALGCPPPQTSAILRVPVSAHSPPSPLRI
jgi:hypothetical protein